MTKRLIRVLFIASEAEPLVKVGGLGDVAGALPKALQEASRGPSCSVDLDVRLCIPFYSCINSEKLSLQRIDKFSIPTKKNPVPGEIYQGSLDGLPLYLIKGKPISESPTIYNLDTEKDGEKFAFFSLAVLEFIRNSDWKPDIIHANDWHTALTLHCLRIAQETEIVFKKIHGIITLHNLPFMGAGTEKALAKYQITPSKDPALPEWAKTLPLPMGLSAAQKIIAVSPNYAHELFSAEFGNSLQSFFKANSEKVMGIINGLDCQAWNPQSDSKIRQTFDVSSLDKRIENKESLLHDLHLDPDNKIPLLVSISRMDQQKGVDIILAGLQKIANLKWRAVILGSGNPRLEKAVKEMEKKHPDRVKAINRYDPTLSHRLYAAADIYMMPSRYEPCGLSQLIAMHYGCVPVARNTGGLHDTIQQTNPGRPGTGYLFQKADAISFSTKLSTAIKDYKNKSFWQKIQVKGMKQDFSWQKSARAYLDVYSELS